MSLNALVFFVQEFLCKSSCCLYLNMSKKGKKQDVTYDSFESYVKDCLETSRQDVETIKNNQAKFKEDLK